MILKHSWNVNAHNMVAFSLFISICFLILQSQFKAQGNKLIPDGAAEQALMYQRMFEGLTFYDKLSEKIFRWQ